LHRAGGCALVRRTRKWAFVAQEATRLAGLGLAPVDIAQRIGVKRSTVQRWMSAGKLSDTRRNARNRRVVEVMKLQKPSEWASTVRKDYALDATDDQLVTLAEAALGRSLDPLLPVPVQLQAMRTFQGLVKQLALIARSADVPAAKPEPAVVPRPVRQRAAGDPRAILTAVK
jgi:hypothetical protein